MTTNILLINNGRILAEGNVHQIRDSDRHPSAHGVHPRGQPARARARVPAARRSSSACAFEPAPSSSKPASRIEFLRKPHELVADGACGPVGEVTSPDDNLQAVFKYLVKN
jgi:ABC-2 type transport system ATP-binding protein